MLFSLTRELHPCKSAIWYMFVSPSEKVISLVASSLSWLMAILDLSLSPQDKGRTAFPAFVSFYLLQRTQTAFILFLRCRLLAFPLDCCQDLLQKSSIMFPHKTLLTVFLLFPCYQLDLAEVRVACDRIGSWRGIQILSCESFLLYRWCPLFLVVEQLWGVIAKLFLYPFFSFIV